MKASPLTLKLSDEERKITLQSLKARLQALRTEVAQTDNPQFSIELAREEKLIQALMERIESLTRGPSLKRPTRALTGGSPGRRAAKGKRRRT